VSSSAFPVRDDSRGQQHAEVAAQLNSVSHSFDGHEVLLQATGVLDSCAGAAHGAQSRDCLRLQDGGDGVDEDGWQKQVFREGIQEVLPTEV
jgi:hypothetical protein